MLPFKSPAQVLYVDDVAVERGAAGWTFTWEEPDVNSMLRREYTVTAEALVAHGPSSRMSADALDALARELGRDPSSLPWCRERRFVEQIVADDLAGVLEQLTVSGAAKRPAKKARPTCATIHGVREPILMLALGVAAWRVAAELVRRGEPLVSPGGTWDAASYAIATLDDSDGATEVLQLLLARGAIVASGQLLRHVRAPRIVHALIDAGAKPNAFKPSSPMLDPNLVDATPLAVAVVHRDNHGPDRFDVAAALLERGASLEARDANGRTALIVAALWGNAEPVRWLLDHGAILECAPDKHGKTPRSFALKRPDDPGSRLILAALAKSE